MGLKIRIDGRIFDIKSEGFGIAVDNVIYDELTEDSVSEEIDRTNPGFDFKGHHYRASSIILEQDPGLYDSIRSKRFAELRKKFFKDIEKSIQEYKLDWKILNEDDFQIRMYRCSKCNNRTHSPYKEGYVFRRCAGECWPCPECDGYLERDDFEIPELSMSYAAYVLKWCADNNHAGEFAEHMVETMYERGGSYVDDIIVETADKILIENGFDGECFACYEEWKQYDRTAEGA